MTARPLSAGGIESPYAWTRLFVSLLLMTVGGSAMYTVSVVLPRIQAEFGVARGDASLPYTAAMVGFGLGGIFMGRLADRFGVIVPILIGAVGLGGGFIVAGASDSLWQFSAAQGLLMGFFGSAATFAPLAADTSKWFSRHRGIAVAICMSGNYLAGALWSQVLRYFFDTAGWRETYFGMGVFCLATMLPLAFVLRRATPVQPDDAPVAGATPVHKNLTIADRSRPLGLSPAVLFGLLCIAGVSCCLAMSMPQVHIVAYCGDLGFGPARGAEMLSLMLGMGIVSRLVSGWISDHIGGLKTLLLGSVLQGVALLMFLFADGLVSLYLVAGMFGLFQGGIVPSYALIIRENFLPTQVGARVGTVLMCTLLGMALGGWMCGAIFDLTGSYRAAFLNGTAWNLLNVGIVVFLLWRARRGGQPTTIMRPA